MDFDEDAGDVFTSRDLWKPSIFYDEGLNVDSSLFPPLELDVPSIKLENPYAPTKVLDQDLRLPDLESFQFGPLPDVDSPDQSTVSIETEPQGDEEDIWELTLNLGPVDKDSRFFTWEHFESPWCAEPRSAYVSEAGPQVFDAALQLHIQADEQSNLPGKVLVFDVFLHSLMNLGLGRSSILFSYDDKQKTFVQTIKDSRISGCSLAAMQSLTQRFLAGGNAFRQLKSFLERTYASNTSIPARVALANAVSTILSAFESHLGQHFQSVETVLQLQRLFNKPQEILFYIKGLVDTVKSARTNEELASGFYDKIQFVEQEDNDLRRMCSTILFMVSKPWLEVASEWTGILQERGTGFSLSRKSFVEVGEATDDQGTTEYIYNVDMMPAFISDEDGRMIFETGNSLRFLRSHHPDHPLTLPDRFGVEAPSLEWKFSWEDMDTITEKAKKYQNSLLAAIQKYGCHTKTFGSLASTHIPESIMGHLSQDVALENSFEKCLQKSSRLFDEPPTEGLPDELEEIVLQTLTSKSNFELSDSFRFTPPISVTPFLSFMPLLSAQAHLVNATTLRLFLRSHHLRTHLSLQRQYHLLGDGVFVSNLSSALFSPELETAERRKGTVRSGVHMGLKLGSRSAWPPASSELRLALMGVLNESYHSSRLYFSTATKHTLSNSGSQRMREREELPGQLNFAIRTLSEADMEKIMDPYSLHALDFLRLQYVPPSPLNLVITSTALEKYDYIFKFLLRLTRMLFVVSHLPRDLFDSDSRRFRIEAHHFVSAIASYIFQTGIREQWEKFELFMDSIERRLQEEDDSSEIGTLVKEGLESLKTAHEQCLDHILFSLLLRRRQKQVMTLLEEIFDAILVFSKSQTDSRDPKVSINDAHVAKHKGIADLYIRFKGKVRVFLSVCRGLTGKREYGKGKGTSEENTIDRLLVSLEMSGYYSS
ncbi:hypothetical protein AOQ84DRAFT_385678 [Glonium stellatum]|uniref:Spindle pole body component n=1 Tax=Glonium stellatum TaxID=574774 RepID=A0A8E2JXQ1_9PEZI|nr:hypothetical protein AOQ84DRAFT_385678 [Glonium stellatum]